MGPAQHAALVCRVKLTPDDDDDGNEVLRHDDPVSAPEPHAARIHDSASQGAVPRLGAHPPLLDAPRESTRFEGRAPHAVPRQLRRCSPGSQRRLAQRMRGLWRRLRGAIPRRCLVCIIRGSMHLRAKHLHSATPKARFMPRPLSRCSGPHSLKQLLLSSKSRRFVSWSFTSFRPTFLTGTVLARNYSSLGLRWHQKGCIDTREQSQPRFVLVPGFPCAQYIEPLLRASVSVSHCCSKL
jgi:hypothetical protein